MASRPILRPVQRYEIRRVFRVPLPFAFRWCTDYTEKDGQLSKEGQGRMILRKTARRIVYEDLSTTPQGWQWSRQTVVLHPPNRWTAEAIGNVRTWKLDYSLHPLPGGTTEFRLVGLRRPAVLGTKNPSQRAMAVELNEMWKNYGDAMERDYRASLGGRGKGREP